RSASLPAPATLRVECRTMTLALSIFAVAFASLCVWLALRIVNRRERWAKWTLAVIVTATPFVYLLGVGPAQWLISREMLSDDSRVQVLEFYSPLDSFYGIAPAPLRPGLTGTSISGSHSRSLSSPFQAFGRNQ